MKLGFPKHHPALTVSPRKPRLCCCTSQHVAKILFNPGGLSLSCDWTRQLAKILFTRVLKSPLWLIAMIVVVMLMLSLQVVFPKTLCITNCPPTHLTIHLKNYVRPLVQKWQMSRMPILCLHLLKVAQLSRLELGCLHTQNGIHYRKLVFCSGKTW